MKQNMAESRKGELVYNAYGSFVLCRVAGGGHGEHRNLL